jgi:hypothetical protein
MPQPIDNRIKGRRPATMATPDPPVGGLVVLLGMVARMPRQRSSARLTRKL